MKNVLNIFAFLALLFSATSCEQDLPVFSDGTARLNFDYDYKIMDKYLEQSYSFVYNGDIKMDTVWVKINSMGKLSDQNRYFEFEQVEAKDTLNAVAGKHYVPFDQMKERYFIPAGANTATVPVVVLRDPTLQTDSYVLKFRVKENENFKRGYAGYDYRKIMITDKLAKPSNWDTYALYYYIETYSVALHRFMIDVTGEKWDEAYIDKACSDSGFLYYIGGYLKTKLEEENKKRAAQGLGPILNDDGKPLEINPFSM